jgi:hypothetical protein
VSARDSRSLCYLALICVYGLAAFAGDTALAQSATDQRARVLFLLPKLETSVRAQLREALEAQLALVDAELLIEDDTPHAVRAPLADRIESSQALAEQERADVVLWLDPGRGVWLLHVLDVGQDRMVVRRIDASQQGAAFEAIAVLAREASRGGPLAIGGQGGEPTAAQPEPRQPVPEPVAPPAAAAAASPPLQRAERPGRPPTVRLSAFYNGVDFAPETSFSHAAGLGARLDWRNGLFIGVHGGWAALAKPVGPLVVQRIPLGAATGYRIALIEDLWADLELGLVMELLHRSTRTANTTQNAEVDSLRVAAALTPRLRAEYKPIDFLGLFAGFGLDVVLTTVPYRLGGASREVVLDPSLVRPALEAGFAFYP